ncbi:MAG: hypothetical protein PV344_01850, partial [Anaplasma sp.]|nr:hypothetical protein [Anaplasma sp.]
SADYQLIAYFVSTHCWPKKVSNNPVHLRDYGKVPGSTTVCDGLLLKHHSEISSERHALAHHRRPPRHWA